ALVEPPGVGERGAAPRSQETLSGELDAAAGLQEGGAEGVVPRDVDRLRRLTAVGDPDDGEVRGLTGQQEVAAGPGERHGGRGAAQRKARPGCAGALLDTESLHRPL